VKLLTLKSYSQFKKVLYKGFKIEREPFVFFYSVKKSVLESSLDNVSKFGFMASRKQFKKAVDRNRAKRRIRAALQEIWRNSENEKSRLTDRDCVFILRKSILNIDFSEIKKSLSTL
jgi:ribonuclease P protein component